MRKIVIVSAHPDDEIIGAGGTLIKHGKLGDEIHWIITTTMTENLGYSIERIRSRDVEINKVAEMVPFKSINRLDYPTTTLNQNHLPDLIGKITEIFRSIQPHTIYIMNRSDAHSDHRITFQATMACTKSFRHPYVKRVLMYECLSETEFSPALPENIFIPNHFVDISEYLERKIEILKIYESELGIPPYPRSIENIRSLATFRGSTCGVRYAEAFQLLFQLE